MKNLIKLILKKNNRILIYDRLRTNNLNLSMLELGIVYNTTIQILLHFTKINVLIIGANDGKTSDPIIETLLLNKDRVNLHLVEANPNLIPLIEENIQSFKNSSITNKIVKVFDEQLTNFYVVDIPPSFDNKSYLYRRLTGISSVNREHVTRHLDTYKKSILKKDKMRMELTVKEVKVDAISFKSLTQSLKLETIDLLQIDIEGLDYEIISNIDFNSNRISLIFFENRHMDLNEIALLNKILISNGFMIINTDGNSFAINRSLFN